MYPICSNTLANVTSRARNMMGGGGSGGSGNSGNNNQGGSGQ